MSTYGIRCFSGALNSGHRLDNYLALHCEMVGIGYRGRQSSVARVSVVNYRGAVQLDEFVQQREPVVDYRTKYSGIRKPDLVKGMARAASS